MIPVDEIAMRPRISFLSKEDQDKIHRAAFQILSEIGMKILQDEALDLLKDAGCSVGEDRMVKIPAELVQQCVDSAPAHIPIHDREGRPGVGVAVDEPARRHTLRADRARDLRERTLAVVATRLLRRGVILCVRHHCDHVVKKPI